MSGFFCTAFACLQTAVQNMSDFRHFATKVARGQVDTMLHALGVTTGRSQPEKIMQRVALGLVAPHEARASGQHLHESPESQAMFTVCIMFTAFI